MPFLYKLLTFKGDPGPFVCVNVIPEVLAILAIGLVNISFINIFSYEKHGPENAT